MSEPTVPSYALADANAVPLREAVSTDEGTQRPAEIAVITEVDGVRKMEIHPHPGQARALASKRRFVAVIAGAQSGKPLSLQTIVQTPSGPRPLGEIKVGDEVFAPDGRAYPVIGESPVYVEHECYRIRFDDGTEVISDGEHRWQVTTYHQRKNARRRQPANVGWTASRPQCQAKPSSSVLDTKTMSRSVMARSKHCNYAIPLAKPLEFEEADLPVRPYTLGAWLGDGLSSTASIVSADREILDQIESEGYVIGEGRESNSGKAKTFRITSSWCWTPNNRFLLGLRELNLIGNKHIPEEYFRASAEQRLALLQGLMDTDGTIGHYCEFSSSIEVLARGALRLIRSLGIKAKIKSRIPKLNGVAKKVSYRVTFSTTLPVFRLPRKAEKIKTEIRDDALNRYITSIEQCESVPVKCISVDSPQNLFLVTESCISTHNTSLGPIWLFFEIKNRGRGDYLVVAPTFSLLELKALPTFTRFFEKQMELGRYIQTPVRRFVFSPQGETLMFGSSDPLNPTTIYFAYAEDPESLESMTVKAAWLDEAGQTKFKLASWQAIQRRLAINQGRALLTTTPYDWGWLKSEVFDRFEAGDTDYDVINFRSTENPAFPEEEYKRAKASMPDWEFALKYDGAFRKPAGLIYNCFSKGFAGKNTCARFHIPAEWGRLLGVDFGGVNTAAVYIAEKPNSPLLYVYRRYHGANRTALEHCYHLREGESEFRIASGGSRGEGQWRMEFRASGQLKLANGEVREIEGINIRKPKEADVRLGITRVYGAFKRNELIIFDDLDDVIAQIEDYRWVLDDNGEPTSEINEKGKAHFCDALRYIVGHVRGPQYEQDLPLSPGLTQVRFQAEGLIDEDALKSLLKQAKEEADAREEAWRAEANRLDKLRQQDIMDPSWGWH